MANTDTMRAAVAIDASVSGTANVKGLTGAMADLNIATADLNKKQAAMAKQLQYTTDTLHMSRSELLQYKADAIGMGTAFNPVIQNLKQMGIDGEHSFKGMIQSGGVFRELLVLMHETLIMGNFSRAGGSLMVLAERMEIAPMLFTAIGGAAALAAGGVALFAAALIKGEMESSHFAEAMSLTGGMAGITEGQFRIMAAAIGQEVPDAASKGRNALLDLIATGQFSGATLQAVGRAATELASYTGQSAEDVVKNFDDMKGNAAAWAEKMNNSYHFLSLAQYEYIKRLQAQGQTERAEQVAADALFTSLATNGVKNLGILQQAWQFVSDTAKDAFNSMENSGRAITLDDQLAARIGYDNGQELGGKGGRMGGTRRANPDTDPTVISLRAQIKKKQDEASASASYLQNQQQGMLASDALDSLRNEFLTPAQRLASDIADVKTQIANELKADPKSLKALADQASLPTFIKNITKRDMPGGGAGAINKPDANGYFIGSDDTDKVSTQVSLMQQYAKATHSTELATLALSIAQGKLHDFTQAEINDLKTKAIADDKLAATQQYQNDLDKAAALQQRYQDTMGGYSDKNIDLKTQIAQMADYGDITKHAELNAINLQIAQGKFAGFPQSEIDSLRAAAAGIDDDNNKMIALSRTASYGTKEAFADYVKNATDAGAQMKQVWTNTFSGMEDIMLAALEGGKVNFDQFALSVVNDLLKMELETKILGPLLAALGGIGGGGFGLSNIIGGGFSLFGSGAESTALSALGARQGVGSSLGLLGSLSHLFADGGIMTSRGKLPLNRYSNGGIANSPQMAMYGEGRGPEAYVPLPDGRSIPVSMKGGGGGGVINSLYY